MKRWSQMRNMSLAIAIFASSVSLLNAEILENPYKEMIPKSDIKVGVKQLTKNLNSPLKLTHAGDGSDRLFVIDQTGQIYILKDNKRLDKPFLDVSKRLVKIKRGFDERGLLGLAFHPGFADKNSPGYKKLYTYTSEPHDPKAKSHEIKLEVVGQKIPPDHQSVITQWEVKDLSDNTVDMSSRKEIMRLDQPQFNHDGGDIVFDKNGLLYIALGDGGGGNDSGPGHSEGGNGQDITNLLGAILRIDPLGKQGAKSDYGPYSIPSDNPFVGKTGKDEIFAYGLRNPYRISIDHKTGMIIAGDVGQEDIEEINIIKKGANYGWPVKEGEFYFVPPQGGKKAQVSTEPIKPLSENQKFIDPVAAYDHDDGISIIGGFVYRGKNLPQLKGKYVFGEWTMIDKSLPKNQRSKPNGRILVADLDKGTIHEIMVGKAGKRLGEIVTGMGEDENGELDVLTNDKRAPLGDGGKVYLITPVE